MEYISIIGAVICQPAIRQNSTEFLLLSQDHTLTVIRADLYWQSMDVLFLDVGQLVEITGQISEIDSNCIYAEKITIITCPRGDTRSVQI